MTRIDFSAASNFAVAIVASLYCTMMFLAAAAPNGAALGRLVI